MKKGFVVLFFAISIMMMPMLAFASPSAGDDTEVPSLYTGEISEKAYHDVTSSVRDRPDDTFYPEKIYGYEAVADAERTAEDLNDIVPAAGPVEFEDPNTWYEEPIF